MKVLLHHIYEYRKGLRNLILHTAPMSERAAVELKLRACGIPCFISVVGTSRFNVFFGDPACVEVVRKIGNKRLSALTPEEDFVLGIMLGYDRLQQCKRYLKRRTTRKEDDSTQLTDSSKSSALQALTRDAYQSVSVGTVS